MTAVQARRLALESRANQMRPMVWSEAKSSVLFPIRTSSATGSPVLGQGHPPCEGVARVSLSRREESVPGGGWLPEALDDLNEIRQGVEVDGPRPTPTAVREARDLLKRLAEVVLDAPGVVDDPAEAVGIDLYGVSGSRLLFVIEKDGQTSYYELMDGYSSRGRFPNWRRMMDAIGRRGIERAGVRLLV